MLAGAIIFMVGIYYWYQTGIKIQGKLSMDASADSITLSSILLIVIGLATIVYGYFE